MSRGPTPLVSLSLITESTVGPHSDPLVTSRPQNLSPHAAMSNTRSLSLALQRPSISRGSSAVNEEAAKLPTTAITTATVIERDCEVMDGSLIVRLKRSPIQQRTKYLLQVCLIGGLAALAVTVGLTALRSATGILSLPHPLALLDARLPGIFRLHMLASGVALLLLPLVLLVRHQPRLHRPLGRIAAGLLCVGVLASLPTALASEVLPLGRAGFFTQGVLCLAYLGTAIAAIRRGNTALHRTCMMSVAALVAGVVLLRIMLAGLTFVPFAFDEMYAVAVWASWMLPLSAVWLWPRLAMRKPLPAGRLITE